MKRKPMGFTAICQCGVTVGALDYERADRNDSARILGKWLSDGCIVMPMFDGTWSASIAPCNCEVLKKEFLE